MQYDMLSYKAAERIWNAFQGHDACVNEKYKAFKCEDSYCYSDRDRFVVKFFKKYTGRYIAFIDKVLVGSKIYDCFFYRDPESTFAVKYRRAVYDKSEVDNVIASHKYKRCLDRAKWCDERIVRCTLQQDIQGISWQKEVKFYRRLKDKYIEISKQFKEA